MPQSRGKFVRSDSPVVRRCLAHPRLAFWDANLRPSPRRGGMQLPINILWLSTIDPPHKEYQQRSRRRILRSICPKVSTGADRLSSRTDFVSYSVGNHFHCKSGGNFGLGHLIKIRATATNLRTAHRTKMPSMAQTALGHDVDRRFGSQSSMVLWGTDPNRAFGHGI